ncbi:MAG: DUF4383 domain-containing protein [Bryobacterales bacterium]|nr:DUF4383 domain-containing protein [Bryobacterales bacterium]
MIRKLAMFWGVIFVAVGLLGFVPNPIVGPNAYFDTDVAHNAAHILLGLLLVVTTRTNALARNGLFIVGAIYLLLAILGFATVGNEGQGHLLGLVHINGRDNWLHLVIAVALFGSGLAHPRTRFEHA